MRALAFDTSSKTGAIVALEWQPGDPLGYAGVRLVSEWSLSVDASFHSERLLWGVHQIVESAGWKLEDLDVIGVGVGPGSFTGLRIGMTTARTLATILSKPLVGVSSLAALARPVALWMAEQKTRALIAAVTDASKGEVFALHGLAESVRECVTMADKDYAGLWKRGVEESVIEPAQLISVLNHKLKDRKIRHWIAIGEGRQRYIESWKSLPGKKEFRSPLPFSDSIQGRYLGMLVWEAFQAGLARNALDVHPRYLRASDAELKLEAGLLPPGPRRIGQA